MKERNFLLIDESILPPVYKGVVVAKELLASGEASNTSRAIEAAGISRTAFYKYKDFVFKYSPQNDGMLTLNAVLSDKAGVFSAFTAALFDFGANILTVNQGLPENGIAVATVTVSLPLSSETELLEDRLSSVDGVKALTILHGGKI